MERHYKDFIGRGHILKATDERKEHEEAHKVHKLTTSIYRLQGLSLLKQLIELDEWSRVFAVARSELPFPSNNIKRIALDLNNKEVNVSCGLSPFLGLLYSAGLAAGHAARGS